MIRVLLTDDHPVVRAGLRAVLAMEDDIDVVAEAATGQAAIDASVEGIDVVLMDLQLGPGLQGVDATAAITARADAPPVLILTTYDSDADIVAALEAGASGYLLKDTPPDELVRAIRQAAEGGSSMSPAVTSRLVDRVRRPATALTGRESEVLVAVAEGLSNRDIAARLVVSEATVKTHLVHIFDKLGVDSRTAAVAAGRSLGILRERG